MLLRQFQLKKKLSFSKTYKLQFGLKRLKSYAGDLNFKISNAAHILSVRIIHFFLHIFETSSKNLLLVIFPDRNVTVRCKMFQLCYDNFSSKKNIILKNLYLNCNLVSIKF